MSGFDETLRRAIARSGLSLNRLRAMLSERGLHVSVASLSHWQSGRSLPEKPSSLEAVDELEIILGLTPGRLRQELRGPRPRGRARSVYDVEGMEEFLAAVGRVERELAFSHGRSNETAAFERLELGVRGEDVHVVTQISTVRALEAGPLRRLSTYRIGDIAERGRVSFTPLFGCEIVGQTYVKDEGLYGIDILVGEYAAGDQAIFGYEMVLEGVPCTDFRELDYSVTRRAHDAVVEVVFAEHLEPLHVQGVVSRGTEEAHTDELSVGLGGRVQLNREGFGPGTLSIRWDWPQE